MLNLLDSLLRLLQGSVLDETVRSILFSTDYPYQYRPEGDARRFVEGLELDATDKAKFAHRHWERLTGNGNADLSSIQSTSV